MGEFEYFLLAFAAVTLFVDAILTLRLHKTEKKLASVNLELAMHKAFAGCARKDNCHEEIDKMIKQLEKENAS